MQRITFPLLAVIAACAAIAPTRSVEPLPSHAKPAELRPARIAKFGRTFSATNDAMPALDSAFAQLQRGMRKHHCLECHADDAGKHGATSFATKVFELRHNIVVVLDANVMPPAEFAGTAGIADEGERLELLALARAFEIAGDAALTREVELP